MLKCWIEIKSEFKEEWLWGNFDPFTAVKWYVGGLYEGKRKEMKLLRKSTKKRIEEKKIKVEGKVKKRLSFLIEYELAWRERRKREIERELVPLDNASASTLVRHHSSRAFSRDLKLPDTRGYFSQRINFQLLIKLNILAIRF